MKKDTKNQTPMLVANPKTGKYIDLNPLWEILNEQYGTVTDLAQAIDNDIRYISLSAVPDDQSFCSFDHQNAIFNLYRIRDAFRDMVKFKEGAE